ncbi:hypothetical protein PI124_g6730 [Phytophthora idaei]|nr:hypothetical protein PI124_g6730 [Phytophthora idaei]
MAPSHSRADLVVRLLGMWEFQFDLRFLSSDLPGGENTIADAGSWVGGPLFPEGIFSSLTHGWSQDPASDSIAALVTPWRSISANTPLQPPPSRLRLAFTYWKTWTTHAIARQLQLPLGEALTYISNFINHIRLRGMGFNKPVRGSTIYLELHGIRHFFQDAGLSFPADHSQVRTFLKGVSRLDAPPRQKEPAFIALIEACLRPLGPQNHTDQAGVLCLAFFFVLHRSEIAATTATTFRWFAPKAADVAVVDAKGSPTLGPSCAAAVCIRLEGSKANQRGPPVVRML